MLEQIMKLDKPTIFYAWQSDKSERLCRYLIRDAAKQAIKDLEKEPEFEESPRIDSDTQGAAGHPEIASTIFTKIDDAAVFLADMTLTGVTTTADGRQKRLANSNVLLELGYASARMGWDRVVLVMNKSFGNPEEQLFDILHRRHPITYELPDDDKENAAAAKQLLTEELKKAFKASFSAQHDKVSLLIRRLDLNCVRVLHDAGRFNWFSGPNPNEFVLGSATGFDTPSYNSAILRLLDLELIYADFQGGQYAYHWTYWGKEVAAALGVRNDGSHSGQRWASIRIHGSYSGNVRGEIGVTLTVENIGLDALPPYKIVIVHPKIGTFGIFPSEKTGPLLPDQERSHFGAIIGPNVFPPNAYGQFRFDHDGKPLTAEDEGDFAVRLVLEDSDKILYENRRIARAFVKVVWQMLDSGGTAAVTWNDWHEMDSSLPDE